MFLSFSRRHISGPRSSGPWRIQIMVSVTLLFLHTFCYTSPSVNTPLCVIIAAIYLAKRNIRKKGILELHEQVRTRPRPASDSCFFSPRWHLLRCYFMSSGAV